jgi:DNA-binding NarL/FixJ family response regulator
LERSRSRAEIERMDSSSNSNLHVLILESDGLCRKYLRETAQKTMPGATVRLVSRVEDAAVALAALPIDLFITRSHLPDGDVFDLLFACAGGRCRPRRIVVVTTRLEEHTLACLRALSVDSIVDADSEGIEQLEHALHVTALGKRYWSAVISRLMHDLATPGKTPAKILSPLEHVALAIVGDGCADARAAELLALKERTVTGLRRDLHWKLGLQHKGEITFVAAQHGHVRVMPDGRVIRPGLAMTLARCSSRKLKLADSLCNPALLKLCPNLYTGGKSFWKNR